MCKVLVMTLCNARYTLATVMAALPME